MEYPLVSIITVNYDQPEVTCELLGSLRRITYPMTEIIVVDNASPTKNPSVIKERFPEVTLIVNNTNTGFAGGNNTGIRKSHGKYLLFLNNDTEVDPGFLEPMVRKLETSPGIGAVSPQIRFYYQPDTIQFAGYAGINPWTVRGRGVGWQRKDLEEFNQDAPTAYLHGAAMMVKADVVRKAGLMAESYFLYYEELDWSNRIRKEGYELWYVHDSIILHKESVSTGKISPVKVYYMNRSRLLFLRRNIHGLQFLVAVAYLLMISFPKNLLRYLVRGNSEYARAYRNAFLWHLRHLYSDEIHINPVL